MHIDIQPRRVELSPGVPSAVTVTISNTGDVIGGYRLRFLGVDPSWVEVQSGDISLFPEESRTVTALLTIPAGLPAGERRLSVQVNEITAPYGHLVEDIVFDVPPSRGTQLTADPAVQTAGRTARYNLVLDNTGNTPLRGLLHGQDAESKVVFDFDPPTVDLAPGEHAVVDLRASARRRLFGSPTIRTLDLHVLDDPGFVVPPPSRWRRRRREPARRVPDDVMAPRSVTFVQQAVVSRGPMALVGLLAAVTVFAVVITMALSRIVGQSAADRNLALEVAAAQNAAAGSGTAGMSGTVRLLTSGLPVPGVAVNVFDADDTDAAVSTTATEDDGTWSVSNLPAGDYKVTFQGAGFVQLWFPRATSASDGLAVSLDSGARRAGVDVDLGGVPASISGTVVGTDVAAATLTLQTPMDDMSGLVGLDGSGATVQSVPIGADGSFTLSDVPSPSVYDLVVEKQGYATARQRVDVSAGEERRGVEIGLRRGDGVISGVINSASGPLAGATVTVSSGTTSVTTMSLTEGEEGAFTVRGLPTPGTFTVVASLDDYATQTQTITLAAGQRLTGVSMTLDQSSGSLKGIVRAKPFDNPAGGVLVTVTDGKQTVQTATGTRDDPGRWSVEGLAVPGTYTVTFSRDDLASQTLSISLDGSGRMSSQTQGAAVTADGMSVTMQPSTATVEGTVRMRSPSGTDAVGEVTVQLTSASETYTVTTASVPAANRGAFRIEGIVPGTYTVSVSRAGVSPTSTLIELKAGEVRDYSPVLAVAPSISGRVVDASGASVGPGWIVEVFRSDDYPATVFRTTTTDADGAFTFPDVDAPEAYVVQVRRTRGSPPAGSTTVQLDRSQAVRVTVRVRANE